MNLFGKQTSERVDDTSVDFRCPNDPESLSHTGNYKEFLTWPLPLP